MSPFKAPSGAEIIINAAPWRDAKALKMAIQQQIGMDANISMDKGADAYMTTILRVDSSPTVDAALWPCLIRCLRDNEKITEATFDPENARQDYYEIVTACIKVNLGPLVEGLFSKLSKLGLLTKKQAKPGNRK